MNNWVAFIPITKLDHSSERLPLLVHARKQTNEAARRFAKVLPVAAKLWIVRIYTHVWFVLVRNQFFPRMWTRTPIAAVSEAYSSCSIRIKTLKLTHEDNLDEGANIKLYSACIKSATAVGHSHVVLTDRTALTHDLCNISKERFSEELHRRFAIDHRRNIIRYKTERPALMLNDAVAINDACSSNYAHWLTEVLPRFALWSELRGDRSMPYIIDAGLPAQMLQSMLLFLEPNAIVHTLVPGAHIKAIELHVPSHAGYVPFETRANHTLLHHGRFHPFAMRLVRERARTAALCASRWKARQPKIYVRRRSRIRAVHNVEEIEEILRSEGFEFIDTETMSFDEQVATFAQAKVIIGPTGAALANILFASPDASIYVLMPNHPDSAFDYWKNIGKSVGVEVHNVLGEPSSNTVALGRHSSYVIQASQLPV